MTGEVPPKTDGQLNNTHKQPYSTRTAWILYVVANADGAIKCREVTRAINGRWANYTVREDLKAMADDGILVERERTHDIGQPMEYDLADGIDGIDLARVSQEAVVAGD